MFHFYNVIGCAACFSCSIDYSIDYTHRILVCNLINSLQTYKSCVKVISFIIHINTRYSDVIVSEAAECRQISCKKIFLKFMPSTCRDAGFIPRYCFKSRTHDREHILEDYWVIVSHKWVYYYPTQIATNKLISMKLGNRNFK